MTLTVTYTVEIVDPLALREAGFRAIREDANLSKVFEGQEDNPKTALALLLRTTPDLPGVRIKGHTVAVEPLGPDELPPTFTREP